MAGTEISVPLADINDELMGMFCPLVGFVEFRIVEPVGFSNSLTSGTIDATLDKISISGEGDGDFLSLDEEGLSAGVLMTELALGTAVDGIGTG